MELGPMVILARDAPPHPTSATGGFGGGFVPRTVKDGGPELKAAAREFTNCLNWNGSAKLLPFLRAESRTRTAQGFEPLLLAPIRMEFPWMRGAP